MGKDWSTWYTVLVLLTALVALGEIAWFLWGTTTGSSCWRG